eukprot:TRINITY_DN91528_c0_g1_i1.p1 TRINITY_DN91528_c0_g1~~TRINITY_DN91528_c0_g1_i1.p1  ORF type:complete len:422 (+),score=48.53 TRINITY_DN91528_c0_g1_i1:38-1267(+)
MAQGWLWLAAWPWGLHSFAEVASDAAPPLRNTPFDALGCTSAIPGDPGRWIWKTAPGSSPSCNFPMRGDGASMCVDSHGAVDYTSLFVDASTLQDRTGCFAWKTLGCSIDLRQVARIEFDFDIRNCGNDWVAPLWLSPQPWLPPAALSGEIDLVEACPVGDLRTNFATGGTQMSIGSPAGLSEPRHIVMTLENSGDVNAPGTLRTRVCRLGGHNCQDSSYYTNFLSTVASTKMKSASDPYMFVSDIWNGIRGDSGWSGCHAHNDPSIGCSFAVRNIRVYTNSRRPMFSGTCAALNGDSGRQPRTPVPPSLSTGGWVRHRGLNCCLGYGSELVLGDDPVRPISTNMSLVQCEAACESSEDCDGIVVPSNGAPQCYRRTRVNMSECLRDPGYDFYHRPGAGKSEGLLEVVV